MFDWDENKNISNKEKHGVSFEEAETVFDDPNAICEYDELHSIDEIRYNLIGFSNFEAFERVLTVCHCQRGGNDEITRIISARRATKLEKVRYTENLK